METDWEAKCRDLEAELVRERRMRQQLEGELQTARKSIESLNREVELEEEALTNKLLKHLESLKEEQKKLVLHIEEEEEFLTNTLQKRLTAVQEEKVDLEQRLEAEQEYMVNKLRKEMELLQTQSSELKRERSSLRDIVEGLRSEQLKLLKEKVDLENYLEAEEEAITHKFQKEIEAIKLQKRDLEREVDKLRRFGRSRNSSFDESSLRSWPPSPAESDRESDMSQDLGHSNSPVMES